MSSSKNSKSSLLNNSMESVENQNDIRKFGYIKKLKTMKKKFFVLRNQSNNGDARLEYYDSEKKFKLVSHHPKRSITLKTCFSINRKIDAKHKYSIALYTKDDCFAVVFDDDCQMNEWLNAMLELQSIADRDDSRHILRPHYDYVWQVNIIKNGLGQSRNMTGVYRLCLTPQALYIVKVNPQMDQPDSYEFPLNSIRRCGNASNVGAFMLELGRASSIGPGELWIQAEDATVAHQMHEVIINAMKTSRSDEIGPPRQRSQSTSENSKPIKSRPSQSASVMSNQTGVSPIGMSIPTYSSLRERCDSMPSRSRDGNEIEHNQESAVQKHYHSASDALRFHSGITKRAISYSPPSNNPMSPCSGISCSTDSAGSSLSIEDHENIQCVPLDHHLTHHIIPSEPPITEEDQIDDYLMMDAKNEPSQSHQRLLDLNLNFRSKSNTRISPVTSPSFSSTKAFGSSIDEEGSYLPMSPVGSIDNDSHGSSRRSSAVDAVSPIEAGSIEYVPMSWSSPGFDMRQSPKNYNYLDMMALSASLPKSSESYSIGNTGDLDPSIHEEFHLDKVKSYFFQKEEDSLDYIKPVRAYSIGSRPQSGATPVLKRINQRSKQSVPHALASVSGYMMGSPLSDESCRTRAYSCGSHANTREARVSAKKKALIDAQFGTTNEELDENVKRRDVSSSAPVLVGVTPRLRSSTVGSRPVLGNTPLDKISSKIGDMMEIDYSKSGGSKSTNEERTRRSSTGNKHQNSRSSSTSSGIGSSNSPSATPSLNELNDKRRDRTSSIAYQNKPEIIKQNDGITLQNDKDNDYLHVVIVTQNQETSFQAKPITTVSTSTPLYTSVPSINLIMSQSPINKSPKNRPLIVSKSNGSKLTRDVKNSESTDSGEYVSLDYSKTSKLPQYSQSHVMKQNIPTNNSKIDTQTSKGTDVPISKNPTLNSNQENTEYINLNEESSNSPPLLSTKLITTQLPEIKKQLSVPNTKNGGKLSINSVSPQTLSSLTSGNKNMKINVHTPQVDIPLLKSSPSPERTAHLIELNSNDSVTSSLGYQPAAINTCESVSLGSGGSLSSSRQSSVSSERELNYASLDLAPCLIATNTESTEERTAKSPRSLKSPAQLSCGNSSSSSSSSSSCATPVGSLLSCGNDLTQDTNGMNSPLSYAEIDFKK